MSTDTKTNAPIQTLRDGSVSIKLWEQTYGEKSFVTVSIDKSYKDKSGEWKQSRSLGDTDLLRLQALIPQAREEIGKWEEYYRQQSRDPEAPRPQKRDMAAERDAAMASASRSVRDDTQEHAPSKPKNRSR